MSPRAFVASITTKGGDYLKRAIFKMCLSYICHFPIQTTLYEVLLYIPHNFAPYHFILMFILQLKYKVSSLRCKKLYISSFKEPPLINLLLYILHYTHGFTHFVTHK